MGEVISNINGYPVEEIVSKLKAIYPKEEFRDAFKLDGPIVKDHFGLPRSAEIVCFKEPMVFRHYIKELADADAIRERGFKCATVPYVQRVSMSTTYWHDLHGLFLTHSNVMPDQIGVPYRNYFIEIRFPAGIPFIKLEDNIFLFPMNKDDRVLLPEFSVGSLES